MYNTQGAYTFGKIKFREFFLSFPELTNFLRFPGFPEL